MTSKWFSMLVVAALSAGCSAYGPASPPQTTRTAVPPRASGATVTTVSLTSSDVSVIRAYYEGSYGGQGRKGNRGLPPGIAKNIERGKPLPPGLAQQAVPRDLLVRLPAPPSGLNYLVVAGKLLLVEVGTQIVRQVLLDAVF